MDTLIQKLDKDSKASITTRDVSSGLPFVDAAWVNANFAAPEDCTETHKDILSFSDSLVAEIAAADTLVIGLPIYNLGGTATFKAWVDMVARARLSFRYTADGLEGLMAGKRAFVAVTSGGTALGSDIDFATPDVQHALKFIGITGVTFIDGSTGKPDAIERANGEIQWISV